MAPRSLSEVTAAATSTPAREHKHVAYIEMAQAQDADEVARMQWAWATQTGVQADKADFVHAFVHRWVTELDQRPTWTARVNGDMRGFLSAVRINSLPSPIGKGRPGYMCPHRTWLPLTGVKASQPHS